MGAARAAIFLFHDRQGRVDDYVVEVLRSLRPYIGWTCVVVNGSLTDTGRRLLTQVSDDVLVRANTGFDIGGYQAGLDHLGWDRVGELAELFLLNNTFFAPVNPWEPVFQAAQSHAEASFWGLTEHGRLSPHPFLADKEMPRHIQSHFIAVRRQLLQDPAFRSYWKTMPPITSYNDSVAHHESRFTAHFNALGHQHFVAYPLERFRTPNPVLEEPMELLEAGCPVLKRRLFFHDPLYLDHCGVSGSQVLAQAVRNGYPEDTLLKGLVRTTAPRVLLANAGLTEVLSGAAADAAVDTMAKPRLRAHALLREPQDLAWLTSALASLPEGNEVLLSCAGTQAQVAAQQLSAQGLSIETRPARLPGVGPVLSLMLDAPELLDDDGSLVVELGSARPYLGDATAARSLLLTGRALTGSPQHLMQAVALFQAHPSLGLLLPAAPVSGSQVLGHGWQGLRSLAQQTASRLGIGVVLDPETPLAPWAGALVARPEALRPLSQQLSTWDPAALAEPRQARAAELLVAYAVLEAGWHCRQAVGPEQVGAAYALLEHRYQSLAALLPGSAFQQLPFLAARVGKDASIGSALRSAVNTRFPHLADSLKPAYRSTKNLLHRLPRPGGRRS